MILRGLSRAAAVALVGFVGFVFALLVWPLSLGVTVFEESNAPLQYAGYLARILEFGWVPTASSDGTWLLVAIPGVWAVLLVLFLSPIVGRPTLEPQGRSLIPSMVAAALIGSFGCALAWVAVVEGCVAALVTERDSFGEWYPRIVLPVYFLAFLVWLVAGFAWYMLLDRAGSARDPARLDRFLRWILAGTCVEMTLGTAAYLFARKRTDCYCALASFWSLAFGAATLLWMCGPWVVLLLTRKERLAWARGACRRCGYLRRTDSELCPECGARHVPSSAQH